MDKSRTKTNDSPPVERNLLSIILELVYFIVLLIPNILSACVQKLWPPKSKSLDGMVVLVTGAGGGLGRELALSFAHCGAVVACVDAAQAAALDTAQEIVRDGERARAYAVDVRQPLQVAELSAALAEDLGPVDVLVTTPGSFHCQGAEQTSDAAARATVDDNFYPLVWMVREFLPKMKQRGVGHIVTVNSMVAHGALAGAAVYTGTSWAVCGFMESVRLEVLLEGFKAIHFTIVSAAVLDNSLSKYFSLNAIQRLGTSSPDQVAALVVNGVRRNQVYVNIPEQIYGMCTIAKLLPTPVVDWALKILSVRSKPTNKTDTNKAD